MCDSLAIGIPIIILLLLALLLLGVFFIRCDPSRSTRTDVYTAIFGTTRSQLVQSLTAQTAPPVHVPHLSVMSPGDANAPPVQQASHSMLRDEDRPDSLVEA